MSKLGGFHNRRQNPLTLQDYKLTKDFLVIFSDLDLGMIDKTFNFCLPIWDVTENLGKRPPSKCFRF